MSIPSNPPPGGRVERLVARYRADHQNRINHILHVYVGWPLCALGVIALPWRPIYCLYGFVAGYAVMWFGHLVFERNIPTIFRYPLTPLVIAWDVVRSLVQARTPASSKREA